MNNHGIRRRNLLAWPAALLPVAAFAESNSGLQGTLRIWGHGSRTQSPMGSLVQAWIQSFQAEHPAVRFEVTLRGDSTAIGGLYTGAADLALIERPPIAIELDGYRPVFGHDPFGVPLATGSLSRPDHALAPVVFVHRSNPLERLTLPQLDALIGADRRRQHPVVRTWGDIGIEGPCRGRPVDVLMPDIASNIPQFLEEAVMLGSQKWCARLTEFGDPERIGEAAVGRRTMQALGDNACAIAIATWPDAGPEVKALALGEGAAGPFVEPTEQSVAQRTYPLVRTLRGYADRAPGQPLAPLVHAFLAHVLGSGGQRAIARDGGYFPLPSALAAQARESLA